MENVVASYNFTLVWYHALPSAVWGGKYYKVPLVQRLCPMILEKSKQLKIAIAITLKYPFRVLYSPL